ncbi:Hypothetical_protein [Hexamita inflata]|uniref:Hypothetical_protein n=1 Tax=Hexamita inflata TaxID=28002 RepID=A0ABP1HR24_9EUKA
MSSTLINLVTFSRFDFEYFRNDSLVSIILVKFFQRMKFLMLKSVIPSQAKNTQKYHCQMQNRTLLHHLFVIVYYFLLQVYRELKRILLALLKAIRLFTGDYVGCTGSTCQTGATVGVCGSF